MTLKQALNISILEAHQKTQQLKPEREAFYSLINQYETKTYLFIEHNIHNHRDCALNIIIEQNSVRKIRANSRNIESDSDERIRIATD